MSVLVFLQIRLPVIVSTSTGLVGSVPFSIALSRSVISSNSGGFKPSEVLGNTGFTCMSSFSSILYSGISSTIPLGSFFDHIHVPGELGSSLASKPLKEGGVQSGIFNRRMRTLGCMDSFVRPLLSPLKYCPGLRWVDPPVMNIPVNESLMCPAA